MAEQLVSGRRVLVVEDEMLVLMAMEDMLADLGCTSIAVAATIEEALALIRAELFDVAILDVNLDGHRSDPIAEALSERGIPFVFSTGYGDKGVSDAFRNHPVLSKPYDHRQLMLALTGLLEPSSGLESRGTPA